MKAALALFAERGFHGTRVPDIAERAAVATGTIYRHFPTKEALVNAVFRDAKRAYAEAVAAALDPAASAQAQSLAVWRALVAWARSDITAFRFLELHHHVDYLDPASRAASDQVHASSLAFLHDASRDGAVRNDLPLEALVGLVSGALAGFIRDAEAGAFALTRETIDASAAAVWRMLAAPPPA